MRFSIKWTLSLGFKIFHSCSYSCHGPRVLFVNNLHANETLNFLNYLYQGACTVKFMYSSSSEPLHQLDLDKIGYLILSRLVWKVMGMSSELLVNVGGSSLLVFKRFLDINTFLRQAQSFPNGNLLTWSTTTLKITRRK